MARTKALTPLFRVSFPSIFNTAKPMQNDDGSVDDSKKPKYEVTMLFEPGTFTDADKKRFEDMKKIVDECAVENFKKPLKDVPGARKPFRKGEEKAHLDGYTQGVLFAKASSFTKPGAVGPDGKTPLKDAEALYAGCYARATVTCYQYNKKGNKGVSFGLSNIMFVKDGDRFDNRTNPADDFGEVAVDDGGESALDDFSDIV